RPAAAGQPRALLGGSRRHARSLSPARQQRGAAREGLDARAGPQPLHRRGDRGALSHECHRPRRTRTGLRRRIPRLGSAGGCSVSDAPSTPYAFSGRPAHELTLDRLAADELATDDVRIHPDTLAHQAEVAERHGNPQLAANFRRAAELARVPDDEVMAMYEALRPHRSTAAELER